MMVAPAPVPMMVAPAPVYTPESYVWDGYEYVGWYGDQYMYWNGGGWMICGPEMMVRFHEWGRYHSDYRSRAYRYERGHELHR